MFKVYILYWLKDAVDFFVAAAMKQDSRERGVQIWCNNCVNYSPILVSFVCSFWCQNLAISFYIDSFKLLILNLCQNLAKWDIWWIGYTYSGTANVWLHSSWESCGVVTTPPTLWATRLQTLSIKPYNIILYLLS